MNCDILEAKSTQTWWKECNESERRYVWMWMKIGMTVTIMHTMLTHSIYYHLLSWMPNIFGIVHRKLSHHIHNFTQTLFSIGFFFFSPTEWEGHFFLSHYAILWNHKLYFIICFFCCCYCCILFPLFGGRWRLIFTIEPGYMFSFFFWNCDAYHSINIFMFRLNFAHWPKELHTHHHKACFTHETVEAVTSPKKWNTKSLWYVFNYERKQMSTALFSLMLHTIHTFRQIQTRKTIYNEWKFSIHTKMKKWDRQRERKRAQKKYKIQHEIAKEAST